MEGVKLLEKTALGMIETMGLVGALEAADAGLKAADVNLLGTDYVRGGLVLVRFEGEVAAVQAAVDAGTAAAQKIGQVFSSHVIPRAMPEVFCMLEDEGVKGKGKGKQGGCSACGGCEGGRRERMAEKENALSYLVQPESPHQPEDYKSWRVVKLRSYVRGLKGFALLPNDIRYATKSVLLEALERYAEKES